MRTLAGYLTHAIEEFPVDPQTIYEVVVVGNSTMRDMFFRQNVYSIGQTPVPLDHRDRNGGGQADDDQPDADGTPLPAADSSRAPASTACRSSAATSAPMPPRACWRSIWPTKSASSRSWTSAPTPSSSSATRTGSSPRRARPARRSRAAPSPAACRGSTARSKTCSVDEDGEFTLGVIGDGAPEGICGSGSSI